LFSYALGRCATCATAAVFIPTDGTISTRAPTRRSSCARDTARSGCRALGWLPRAFLAKIRVEECCNIYKGTQQLPERDGEERTHASLELENHVRVCRGTPPTVAPTRRPTVLCVSPPPLTPGRVGKGKKTPDGPAEGAPPPPYCCPYPCPYCTPRAGPGRTARPGGSGARLQHHALTRARGRGRVRSVREEGRDVSGQYGRRDETCPVSTGGRAGVARACSTTL
jgi:hypothetical protein